MIGPGSLGAKAPLQDRRDDLYETPDVAVEALYQVEKLPHNIWECACGPGAIARRLRHHGHHVLATDLVDYGLEDSEAGVDFLLEHKLPPGIEAIVSNPPFKLANEFVAKALELCPRVVMLLRLAFLESDRRSSILDNGYLARVYVFANRLPMMHRASWAGNRTSNPTAFAWFVWCKQHEGPAHLRRLHWRPPSTPASSAPAVEVASKRQLTGGAL